MVDDAGYDLILEVPGIVRHVQLKGSFVTSTTAKQNVHVRLAEKPSGCVVWIRYDHDFQLSPFYWFGNEPGKRLPCLSEFKHAKTTRANAKGEKLTRSNIHVIPKGRFTALETIAEVAESLFGKLNRGNTVGTLDQDSDCQ